ncbi:MAG: hypothetical protein D3908_00050 [Candidatus Electrothrix sp. AUS4]|nr:hypothetical protein [Candidatus Electrothrix sp. AUS4]
MRQGAFEEINATAACSGATGTKYTRSNALCLTMEETVTPKKVTSFAARGNFLNWAMASKFDVEKKILTGGKFNYYEQIMVGEHRGCSGSRFVKQVKLDSGKFLTLGVRGSKYSASEPFMWDRIDTTDDTARLEILAVTEAGFKPSAECQEMINTITTQPNNGANWKSAIDACLGTFPDTNTELADQNPILNHGLQFCSKVADGSTRDVNVITAECEDLYTGTGVSRPYDPAELEPEYGAYLCFGLYDSTVSAAERAGYVGRCWKPSSGVTKTCVPKPATVENLCAAYPCTYQKTEGSPAKTNRYLNEIPAGGTVAYVYKCTKSAANASKDDGFGCTKADGDTAGSRENWELQYMWQKITGAYEGTCTGPDDVSPDATPADWENAADAAAVEECIIQASIDYCNDISVPEVIDPSDEAGDTTITWNIPGVLTDSQILAQLGGTHPLAVLKGYIAEGDRPQGVIQSVAQDLRLGAMSFNYVGAATECEPEYLTTGIEKYCPKNNRDGAILLSELDSGDLVVDENDPTYPDNNNKRRHVDDIAQEINDIRATSWTPLGEALYGALGYYTQNTKLCLNCIERNDDGSCKETPGNCLDYPVCINYASDIDSDGDGKSDNPYAQYCIDPDPVDDPVQYWCQDNHILVITEGQSTADINASVSSFPVDTGDSRFLSAETADNLIGDSDGDNTVGCGDNLYSNTFFDDMTWWGQNVYPLYRNRYLIDPDGNYEQKQNITTHVVTTGTLTESGAGECNPVNLMLSAAINGGTDNYYSGESPDELEDNLYAVLSDIMSRASSGSAASVISDSRSGSGAMYQAVFWPEFEDNAIPEPNKITWAGDVRSLLLDSDGTMYEDTTPDGKLDTTEDREIVFYYSNNVGRTRGCYDIDGYNKGPDGVEGTIDDYQCPGDWDPERVPCCDDTDNPGCQPATAGCGTFPLECDPAVDACVESLDVKYLWSANKQLREMDVLTERKIYTWNDINNDGIVDKNDGEWFLLNEDTKWEELNNKAAVAGKRGDVTKDFLTSDDWETFVSAFDPSKTEQDKELYAMGSLTKWLLGVDQAAESSDVDGNGWLDRGLRSRTYNFSDTTDTDKQIWRLGDVIHSAPTTVSKPAESYDKIYRDPTYSDFGDYWDKRRIMVYFGGNDGMLHAVNGGFYFEDTKQFCCGIKTVTKEDGSKEVVCDGTPVDGVCSDGRDLGKELWAYVPYNLQPHLKCLANEFYDHKYYVDLKPRIFDVQIFAEESACRDIKGNLIEYDPASGCVHPGGWGTILVGGMRFGGAPVDAMTLNDFVNSSDGVDKKDPRQFTSSYFILDITNPEAPPELLGELTRNTDEIVGYKDTPVNSDYCEKIDICLADSDPDPGDTPDLYQDCKDKAVCVNDFVDLNYTTSSPAMIIMRDGGVNAVSSKWYMVLGNGPSDIDGTNAKDEQGKIAILPLDWLKGPALNWSTRGIPSSNGAKTAARIYDEKPSAAHNQGGVYRVPLADGASYVSDIISVDYNIGAYNDTGDDLGVRYRTDAIYFGTADGTWHPEYPNDFYVKSGEQRYWNGGGRLFRLVTKVLGTDGKEQASLPEDWANVWTDEDPLRMLIDLKGPMVAAPSVAYDGYNYWIYGGVGRFYDELDRTDDGRCLPVNPVCLEPGKCTDDPACSSDPACTGDCDARSNMAYFGIKEPVKDDKNTFDGWKTAAVPVLTAGFDCYAIGNPNNKDGLDPVMTWGTIAWDFDAWSLTNGEIAIGASKTEIPNQNLDPTEAQGKRGLMQTDNILVGNSSGYLACWHCYLDGDSFKCIPYSQDKCYAGVSADTRFVDLGTDPIFDDEAAGGAGAYTFTKLESYIAGTGCREDSDGKKVATGLDGWYHIFHDPRERNISTSSLLGNMLYFTTYQPFNDKCKGEGMSFLYGLYYKTGTASVDDSIGTFEIDSDGNTSTREHGDPDPLEFDLQKTPRPGLVMPPTLQSGADGLNAILTDAAGKTEKQGVGSDGSIKSGRVNWSDQCTPTP